MLNPSASCAAEFHNPDSEQRIAALYSWIAHEFIPAFVEQYQSLNGFPNASTAECGGRCCVPICLGCIPIVFQTRSAVAFI